MEGGGQASDLRLVIGRNIAPPNLLRAPRCKLTSKHCARSRFCRSHRRGGKLQTAFNIGTDVFAFASAAFGVGGIQFINTAAGNFPGSGVNTVVLQTFDNDNNPATPFGAGNAANLIANQITSPGPGFFIYFNSGLDLPRLVYSTDLSDNQADLKILARLLNLSGQAGRDGVIW